MNAQQYIEFIQQVWIRDQHCKHGHYGCSDVPGGKCCDEEYANLADKDREIVDDEGY